VNNNADFFNDEKGAAAVLKHGVLKRYAAKFMAKTSSTSKDQRVGFLDGYAGQGEYLNPITGVTSEGSPRIVLGIAQDLAQKFGRTSHLVFVERERVAYNALKAMVDQSGYQPAVALQGDISKHLQTALDQFADMPALVFLDPFGSTLDHETLVEQVLKRSPNQPTELLLNFSIQALQRMGARLWEAEGASGRAKTIERVDTWLGGDWWRAFFADPEILRLPKSERAHAAALNVARENARRINKATGCGYFAVPVRRKPSHKPIFFLTLHYPRSVAVFDFNEAVSMALYEWRKFLHEVELSAAEIEDERDPQLMSRVEELKMVYDADEKQIDRDAIDAIKDAITEALATRPSISVRNNFGMVMGEGIGVGREKHIRAAWKELAAQGVVMECPKGDLDSVVIAAA
jgi:three-Cys-motif partner protein